MCSLWYFPSVVCSAVEWPAFCDFGTSERGKVALSAEVAERSGATLHFSLKLRKGKMITPLFYFAFTLCWEK